MSDPGRREIRLLAEDLAALGVRRGGLLLVHSSLSSMGWVRGGAVTVIAGLRQALGPQGTLLMPALSYEYVNAAHPVFDQASTPSCVGVVSECFRTTEGVKRSLAPTHSVCGAGPLAGWILGRHHIDRTPCGAHSPFRAVRDLGGRILFLGCGMRPNTSMHGVEELIEPPYLFGGLVRYRLIAGNGARLDSSVRCHAFDGWAQRYDRVADLLQSTELLAGTVRGATAQLVDAAALWDRAAAALRRNPFAFVEAR